MTARGKGRPLCVEVPGPADEKLRFGRVFMIALLGFAIGIAWPRLAGIRLVPSAPTQDDQVGSAHPAVSVAVVASAPPSLAKPVAVEPPNSSAQAASLLRISEPQVASCRDAAKKRLRDCDRLDIDRVLRPRVLALAACPAAEHARGSLSLGFELDFAANRITHAVSGKSTTLSSRESDAVLACANRGLANVTLAGVQHRATQYMLFYKVDFASPAASSVPAADSASAEAEPAAASGRATVIWEAAILRSAPSKESEEVARVLRGTRLNVTGRKADWYKVKYDAQGNEGWVYRTAIGL